MINRPPVLLKVVRSYSTTIYTGVIQEQSERKRVVKSEVVKVNHCEPKSGDKCRNRKVKLSEDFFLRFSSLFLCITLV